MSSDTGLDMKRLSAASSGQTVKVTTALGPVESAPFVILSERRADGTTSQRVHSLEHLLPHRLIHCGHFDASDPDALCSYARTYRTAATVAFVDAQEAFVIFDFATVHADGGMTPGACLFTASCASTGEGWARSEVIEKLSKAGISTFKGSYLHE